ncbi:MAG: TetR/AcrR family transcriptional regulator [Rhodospirillales bacterium]
MPKRVDHTQRRKDIAAAACRVIARVGAGRATMAGIAEESGYTTGMVTHYYKRKEDILRAALHVMFERADARLGAMMQGADFAASGAAGSGAPGSGVIDAVMDVLPVDAARRREAAVWVSFWGLVVSDKAFARINRSVHRDWIGVTERIIRARWPESGAWPKPLMRETRVHLLSLINGLTAGAVTSPADYPPAVQRAAVEGAFAMIDAKLTKLARPAKLEGARHAV